MVIRFMCLRGEHLNVKHRILQVRRHGGVKQGQAPCVLSALFLVLQYLGVPETENPDAGKNSTESAIVTLFVCPKG